MSLNWLKREKAGPRSAAWKRRSHAKMVRPRLELLEERLAPAIVAWDGGGGDLNWNNPLNWDTDTLPDTGDQVQIDIPGSNTITHSSGTTAVSLVSHAAIDLTGGSFTIAGGQIFSPFTVKGGLLTLYSQLDGPGTVTVEAGQSLQTNGMTLNAPLLLEGTLTVCGVLFAPGDNITTAPGSKIRVGSHIETPFTGNLDFDHATIILNHGFT